MRYWRLIRQEQLPLGVVPKVLHLACPLVQQDGGGHLSVASAGPAAGLGLCRVSVASAGSVWPRTRSLGGLSERIQWNVVVRRGTAGSARLVTMWAGLPSPGLSSVVGGQGMGVIVMMSPLGQGRAAARPQCVRHVDSEEKRERVACRPISPQQTRSSGPCASLCEAVCALRALGSRRPSLLAVGSAVLLRSGGGGALRRGSTVERAWVTPLSQWAGSLRTYKRKVRLLVLA